MSLGLGLPAALWALAALALPLLLHLARRERQREQVFAALRWLAPKSRPRQRLRLEEWPLLAVRLALFAALALLLAQPWLRREGGGLGWWLVHPATEPAPVPEGFEGRWLAPGFPRLDTPRPPPPDAPASLLREADAALPAGRALAVHVPARLDGLDGERPRLSRDVDWRIAATTAGDDPEATVPPAPRLFVSGGDADPATLRWVRALHAAWQAGQAGAAPPGVLAGDAVPATADGLLVHPGHAALPAALRDWVAAGGWVLLDAGAPAPSADAPVLARDAEGAPLLRGAALGRGQWRQWTRPRDPAALPDLLDPGFPARLREALWPPPSPARAPAQEMRPLAGAAAPTPPPMPLEGPWAWAVLALFALERLLATRPGRGAPA